MFYMLQLNKISNRQKIFDFRFSACIARKTDAEQFSLPGQVSGTVRVPACHGAGSTSSGLPWCRE